MTYPKSPAQFRRQAEAGFRRANPDAEGIEFEWTFGPKRVTYPTGLVGFRGHGTVSAEGYGRKGFVASVDRESGLSVTASGGEFMRDVAARLLNAAR